VNALRNITGGDDYDENSDESDEAEKASNDDSDDQDAFDNSDADVSDGELEVVESSSEGSSKSSSEVSSDDESNHEQDGLYTAPSGVVWRDDVPPPRRLARNIINFRSGARVIPRSECDAFSLFVDEVMLKNIQRYTNRRMRAVGKFPFSYSEMKAAVAIIIRAGADRDNLSTIQSLFHPKDSRPFYCCAMAKNRFRQFMRYVTVDNRCTRRERQKTDKLAAVREIWSLFTSKLRKFYEPSASLTVDEQLYGYRGYVPGRAYMPDKPSKYGTKIYWLCDAENGYALEAVLYAGKNDDTRAVGLAQKIVLELTCPYYGTNRNIYMDRYFNSFSLLEELLANGLTMTGTIVSTRRDVPLNIRAVTGREVYSSRFLWNHEKRAVLCSYVPKKNKNVLLISSAQNTNSVSDREDKKPTLILEYNAGKGGVDLMDSRIEDFSCKRKTARYPLIFLFNILDVSLLNAFLIYQSHGYTNDRKTFIKQVRCKINKNSFKIT
jgi:hypothetical protein